MKERNSYKKRALFHVTKVLWHLDIFRRSFRELSGHACMSDSCIFCALKDLFGQLQFSHERALPPDSLRKALAQSFTDQHRFQLGFMDDAAECFENILLRIHFHIAYEEAEDMCNAKHCIPHQKFAMTLVEQSVCGVCHATSEPLPFTQMVHYVSASALISQAEQIIDSSHPDLFGQLLKKAGGMGDIRDCPSLCGAKIQIRRTLINRPEIVSVGIVWDSDRPSLEHIMSLLSTLRTHLRLSDVFHGSFDPHFKDTMYHQLVGVVTYYGKHYSTFFFHTKLRVWVYFDDANVREVGPHWDQVVEKCRRGRYQPLLLLFAIPNGSPLEASDAPKSITLVDRPTMNGRSGHDNIGVGKPPIRRGSLSPTCSRVMGGRRSLTPSPEKPRLGNDLTQRRAVTPNPEQCAVQTNQKQLQSNNDYQNLVQYQEMIFNRPSNVCGGVEEQNGDKRDSLDKHGAGHFFRKDLVRRDSGNWSGDRNSASSSSSTSLENPYHYIIGKLQTRTYGGVPRSPNKSGDLSNNSGNSSGGPVDPGYDSFSLSSTDSLPIQQNLKHNFQLAQIPEGHLTPTGSCHLNDENSRVADDCERLCAEVDQLLDRSEQAEDLITALSLCNAAVNKARAAMDAPYSNPQTASFATMKHNACVLRARSLHRRLEEPLHNNLKYGESRHSREGSGCSTRGSGSSHSRQNSRDKGNHLHSRQNSQELLDSNSHILKASVSSSSSLPLKATYELKPTREKLSPSKNIEIYATLPKNKKGLLSRSTPKAKNVVEDEEYLMKERPGRSLLGNRSKTAASKKEIEKRTRSEERTTKSAKEMITSAVVSAKDLEKEQKDSKKQCKPDEKQQNKKQHKIRRKLLMGGLMRRKNRSMPDLREDESGAIKESSSSKSAIKEISKDDSMVNSKTAIRSNLNAGYLSEGNLEYAGNPNLERSKLMRKSFHGSKVLQFSKVPPPPPLRTTSQLSKIEQHRALNETAVVYANSQKCWTEAGTDAAVEPTPLPFLPPRSSVRENNLKTDAITYSNGGFLLSQTQSSLPFSSFPSSSSSSSTSSSSHMVVTKALIHHEASFQSLQPSIVDSSSPNCLANKVTDDGNFQLPPYPSPVHSALHSRQASEEFPPPPPATLPTFSDGSAESSFLTMLREKCETMSMNAKAEIEREKKSWSCGDENWLKELQAKQAEKKKETDPLVTSWQNESKNVKDLKYKFEQLGIDEVDYVPKVNAKEEKLSLLSSLPLSPLLPPTSASSLSSGFSGEKLESFSNLKSSLLSDCVGEDRGLDCTRRKSSKKKNVTFCEQVVLVATADDEESDNYIPNPILERVLRTVLHKETNVESREHAIHSVVPLKRTDSWCLSKESTLKSYTESTDAPGTPAEPSKDLKLPPRTKQCGDGGGASAELPNQSSNPPPAELTLDDVDGCCPASQMQNQYHSSSYATSIAYSPTYMPASSFCGSSNAFEHRQSSRSEHPDLMTPVHESVDKSSIGFSESCNEKYARSSANLSTNVSVNPVSRKLNDTYLENVRYSPVCHREESSSQKSDGGESYSGYSSYQTAPAFYQQHYSGSPSYQPMSLQYHLSQSRSSPHHTDAKNSPSATNDGGGSLYPSPSLIRQNSNASYYNQQISPSHDSRRNPVASLPSAVVAAVTSPSPPPSLNSRSQQYPNGNSCNQNINDGSSVYTASNNGGSVSETLYSYSYEAPPKSVLSNMVSPQHCSNSSAVPYSTSNQHDTSSSLGFTHQISTNHHHSSLGSPSQHGVLSSTNAYQSMCPFSSNSTSSSLTHSISYQHTGSTTSNIHDTSSQQCLSRSTNMQNHLSPNHRITSSSSGTPQPLLKCNNNNNNNNNNNDNNRNSSSSSSSSTSSSMAHQVSVQHSCNLLNMPYPLSNFYSSSHQTPAQHNFQSTYTATHPASSQRTNSLPHHTQCSQLAASNSSGPPYNAANVHQMQHGLNSVSPQNSTNTHQPHHYSPNSCDNLCSRPLATISPYQSVPHNSFAYELHSRGSILSGGISSPYQHSAPLHSVNTSSCAYQPINKFNGTSQRSNLPPVYQHPPPPQPTSSTKCNVYQRVPTPNQLTRPDCSNLPSTKYAAYQPSPMKTNVTSAASIGGVVPCNLCRKKQISPPSVYCADCDFYISRFKQT